MTLSPTPHPPITVRPVKTVAEYRACQEIQRRAWGITEDGYVVPVATMISVQHAGGLVLGAFEGERLIGFAFGYLGRVRGRWALYSQLAGVDPGVQSHGVGGMLKQAQRRWAKAQGLALVAWSFDPLQAGNASFNLHRLGAFCRTYEVNYFGERSDSLNAGLDTDRLLAEWPVDDVPFEWLGEEEQTLDLIAVNAEFGTRNAEFRHDRPVLAFRAPPSALRLAMHPPLRLDIPPDLAQVKAHHPALARAWQVAVREAFRWAFAAGYVAMDFGKATSAKGARGWYVLRRPAGGLDGVT